MKSSKESSSNGGANKSSIAQARTAAGATDAIALLKQDHRNVEALFKEFKTADQGEKQRLVQRICNELMIHTLLEEEIFYKECRDRGVESDVLDEAQVEHDSTKVLIQDLLSGEPGSEFYDAKVTVLSEYIKHHVGEEEKPGEGIFAKAKKKGLDMSALGQRLQARKQQLMQKAEANELGPPSPRALNLQSSQEYSNMPRYSNERDRDERGRFMSDDDDDRRYSRGRSSRYEDDDNNRRYSGSQSSSRYEDDNDNRRYSGSRSSSRYEDDDDRGGGRGRGRGGWFGDSEGHAEAARSRGGSSRYESSSRYEDDDDGYRRRGSGGGRGRSGWYGDPEGQSEATRSRRSSSRYDEDDDRGGSRGRGRGGWFGDPEGHAEAARQRWEDDDRGSRSSRSRSSSRQDDDDDGRGHGQGGWFGDPEGHSRASRRGSRDRD